jgi:hypothetical protein
VANVSVVANSSYTCVNTRQTGALDEIYACQTTISSQSTLTISSLFFGTSTIVGKIVTTVNSGDLIFAEGIAIARASTDPAWPTTSSITSTTTLVSIPSRTTSQFVVATGTAKAYKGANLNDGAKAGIGIAAALGGLLLIGLGYLISRWRHQKRATHQGGAATESQVHGQAREGKISSYEMPAGAESRGAELSSYEMPAGAESRGAELSSYEMPAGAC